MAPPSANPLAQDSRLQVDAVVAHRYRVVAHARACGFGQVYEVEDEVTGTQVGLMRLAPEFAQDGVRERFIDRRLSATLDDPRVVDVLDLGEDLDGRLYLVMPWIEGETLLDRLDRESPLPWAIARDLVVEIAGALSAAHEVGLVHGALDPQRVLLPKEGGVMVVDFGLAASLPANPLDAGARQGRSETLTNMLPGDPRYLAPEQIRGEAGDIRSDVYALGVLAWELVSGTPPFGAGSLVEVVQAQLEAPLPELVRLGGAPVEIEALLHLALAKAPDERFASVEEFAVTLGALDASSRRTMVPRSSAPTGAHRALTGRHAAVSTKPRKAGARKPKPRKAPASPASRATMVAGSAPSSDSAAVKGSVSLGEQATMLSEGLTSRPSRPSTKLEKRKPPKLKPRRPPDGVQPRKHTQSAQITEAVPALDMEAIEAEERRSEGAVAVAWAETSPPRARPPSRARGRPSSPQGAAKRQGARGRRARELEHRGRDPHRPRDAGGALDERARGRGGRQRDQAGRGERGSDSGPKLVSNRADGDQRGGQGAPPSAGRRGGRAEPEPRADHPASGTKARRSGLAREGDHRVLAVRPAGLRGLQDLRRLEGGARGRGRRGRARPG
ncbi:serine/threonine protein kinase [Plesiocystis pacifica SIR-1]|uniref:Serine/threonine protein kinase n=1 Tax=Plesiocystis pacifica SIR-1 TaxID=391625 RepID=A6FXA1_9BACT|nr:serine/threonine-protein kinase [Plesiocystis pacifica]EDM81925.1 serine/threonine protein kinase [Plesiocystis pacifica SIR-1]